MAPMPVLNRVRDQIPPIGIRKRQRMLMIPSNASVFGVTARRSPQMRIGETLNANGKMTKKKVRRRVAKVRNKTAKDALSISESTIDWFLN